MSLFAAISAVATDAAEPERCSARRRSTSDDDDGEDDFELDARAAAAARRADGRRPAAPVLTRREEKRQLRDANAHRRARARAPNRGSTHAQVNAELNRLSGVGKVSEATVEQLERRLVAADRWLAKT